MRHQSIGRREPERVQSEKMNLSPGFSTPLNSRSRVRGHVRRELSFLRRFSSPGFISRRGVFQFLRCEVSKLTSSSNDVVYLLDDISLIQAVEVRVAEDSSSSHMHQRPSTDESEHKHGGYIPLGLGMFDKPLPCCGCGIGWFCLLVGFVCPLTWYFATILYFCNYYQRDPRERAGLATSAMAAMLFTIGVFVVLAVIIL